MATILPVISGYLSEKLFQAETRPNTVIALIDPKDGAQ